MKSFLKEHSSVIYLRMIRTYQYLTVLFHLDLLKPNFRLKPMIVVAYLLIFHYFLSTVYTIITKWSDKGVVLRSLCLEGINIQLFVKVTMLLHYRKELYELTEEILAIHNESEGEHQNVMYIWTWRTATLSKLQGLLCFFDAVGFCLFPLYGYFVLNEKTVIYDLLLPFDINTKNGYAMTIAVQIFLTYGSTIGMFAVDMLFMIMILSGVAYIDLLVCDCKILSAQIEDSMKDIELTITTSERDVFDIEFHRLLLKIIRRSQDINQFFSKLCVIFEKGCLFQVYSCALSILLCVFVAQVSTWFGVYLLAMTLIFELASYCALGTVVEYKSEEVAKSVYDIPWHNLSIKDQKMLKFLLQHVQRTITITVFGATKLNVQTGCDVFNKIYSAYLMMQHIY